MSLPDRTPQEIRAAVGNTTAARGNIVHVSKSNSDNESEGQLTEDISRIQSAIKFYKIDGTPYIPDDLVRLSPTLGQVFVCIANTQGAFDASKWLLVGDGGVNWHEPVKVATTEQVDFSNGFEVGDTIDRYVLLLSDRILIKEQDDATQNGIYIVQGSGQPFRAPDLNADAQFVAELSVMVQQGTQNKGKFFRLETIGATTTNTKKFTELETHNTLKDPVRAASTVNIVTSPAGFNDLKSGLVMDGVTLATGDRVLLKNQSSNVNNGIYIVEQDENTVPLRSHDLFNNDQFISELAMFVQEGTAFKGKMFRLFSIDPILLTSGKDFTEFPGGSTSSKWTESVNTIFPTNERRVGLGNIQDAKALLHMTEALMIDDTGIKLKTGNIAITDTSATITGDGTEFLTELQIGDSISAVGIPTDSIILSINSDTSLVINVPATATIASQSFSAFNAHLILRTGGGSNIDSGFDHKFEFGLGIYPPKFKFHLNGNLGYQSELQESSPVDLAEKAVHLVDTSDAKIINIPESQHITDSTIFIKDSNGNAGTNNITINSLFPTTPKKFDGADNIIINADFASVLIRYDGIQWGILART